MCVNLSMGRKKRERYTERGREGEGEKDRQRESVGSDKSYLSLSDTLQSPDFT